MRYLIETTEVYRVDSEDEAKVVVENENVISKPLFNFLIFSFRYLISLTKHRASYSFLFNSFSSSILLTRYS